MKPTLKQKNLVRNLIEELETGKVSSVRSLLLRSGYSVHSANKPNEVMQTKGVRQLMEKAGLTVEKTLDKLKEFVDDGYRGKPKPSDHLKALETVAKMQGIHDGSGAGIKRASIILRKYITVKPEEAVIDAT